MYILSGIFFLKVLSDKFKAAKKIVNQIVKNEDLRNDIDILKKYGAYFIIPRKAQWDYISEFAGQPTIGKVLDDALVAIENEPGNQSLKGLLDKEYNNEDIDQKRLGKVISIITNSSTKEFKEDWIGRTYEYFIGKFMMKQGQKGGEFYTPQCIVELLVRLIKPKGNKIYDPACGSGGMFLQTKHYLESIGEKTHGLMIFGQEFQNKTRKIALINLFIHGFESGDVYLGTMAADTFTNDQHKKLKVDTVLANPPFNYKKWGYDELQDDERFEWGMPPKGNANFAWISVVLSKLNKTGKAGVVLANGALSSSNKNETEIRKNLIESNILEAIVTLPSKLFFTTQIPASLWIFNKNKKRKDFLMIDASDFPGDMLSKKLRVIKKEEIDQIVKVFNNFQNSDQAIDEVGFAKSVSVAEIKENEYVLVPGRYVGFKEEEIDQEKIKAEIKEKGIELKKLLKELEDLTPDIEKAIEEALKYQKED